MGDSKHTYSLADMRAYLRDELPERERTAMDAALLEDPLLAGAMEALEERLEKKALDDASLDELTSSFRKAIKTGQGEETGGKSIYISVPQIRRYVAIVVIFLAVGWLLPRYVGSGNSPQELFAENFTAYEDVISSRSAGSEDMAMKEAMEHYNAQRYDKAFTSFEGVLQVNDRAAFALLYGSISALKIDKTEEAVASLQKLKGLENPVLQDIGQWYLALAFLKKEEVDQAKLALEELVEGNSSYKDQAADLLDRL